MAKSVGDELRRGFQVALRVVGCVEMTHLVQPGAFDGRRALVKRMLAGVWREAILDALEASGDEGWRVAGDLVRERLREAPRRSVGDELTPHRVETENFRQASKTETENFIRAYENPQQLMLNLVDWAEI